MKSKLNAKNRTIATGRAKHWLRDFVIASVIGLPHPLPLCCLEKAGSLKMRAESAWSLVKRWPVQLLCWSPLLA